MFQLKLTIVTSFCFQCYLNRNEVDEAIFREVSHCIVLTVKRVSFVFHLCCVLVLNVNRFSVPHC